VSRTHSTRSAVGSETPGKGPPCRVSETVRPGPETDPGGERRPREDEGGNLTITAGATGGERPEGPRPARDAKVARGAANQWAATLSVRNTPKVT
jgi:hypothetical protein